MQSFLLRHNMDKRYYVIEHCPCCESRINSDELEDEIED